MNLKNLITFLFLSLAIQLLADDIIVMRNGDLINAKILEITPSEIKYKKPTRPDGPIYTINKADVLAINYEDGEKETFEPKLEQKSNETQDNSSKDNKEFDSLELFEIYNNYELSFLGANPTELSDYFIGTFGVDPKSFLADENIMISLMAFKKDKDELKPISQCEKCDSWEEQSIILFVTNKSNNLQYIDLSKSFIKDKRGITSLYDPTITASTQSSSSGASLNLGALTSAIGIGGAVGTLASGINVGGNEGNATTTFHVNDKIICIPPQSSLQLISEEINKVNIPYYEVNRWGYGLNIGEKSNKPYQGTIFNYNADNSPIDISFVITFADNEEQKNAKTTTTRLYLRSLLCYDSFKRFSTLKLSNASNINESKLSCTFRIIHEKKKPAIPLIK